MQHWDTRPETPGFNDNGVGVAAVLEVARVLSGVGKRPKHSVMFALFDLEEYGGQGSAEFVQRLLVPSVIQR